ncbi:hypothetical protein [Croceicoccus mobilis]|uniref:Alkaline proteinase inhibitor/ Outer membrane lipoprotein Omp19 domain-containing protein n=1 Tax=Croceicoccus mobilis TaxID=1703339 RepID=A0A916YXX5_9SPHN|nr:hypothetical protein [Croceicoccus mobilis]GGD65089.1 hypothetical protein GCM10010990_13210 [Croceicoccus mobilis]
MRIASSLFLTRTLAAAAVLALASCGPSAQDEENGGIDDATADMASDDAASDDAASDDAPMPVEPDGGIGDGATGPGIPAAFQGNWGMNAADCEGGAAAKGLLKIDGDTLTFYESVGTLAEIEQSRPGSLRADFAFEGEGMEWNRSMLLETADNGEALYRREYGDGAVPGAFRYQKCS